MFEPIQFDTPLGVCARRITMILYLMTGTIGTFFLALALVCFLNHSPIGSCYATAIGGSLLTYSPFFAKRYCVGQIQVDSSGITILRKAPKLDPIVIPKDTIKRVQTVSYQEAFHGGPWLCYRGGFYGYYGEFWSDRLHNYRSYVTDEHSLVLVERKGEEPVLISPDEPNRFVDQVHQLLEVE
jgi:hypothetical protein